MNFIEIIFLGFVCFRLSQLIAFDEWPFMVMKKVRTYFGRKAANIGEPFRTIAELLSCPYCLGIWISFGLAFIISDSVGKLFLNSFAIAGIQAFLEGLVNRRYILE